MYRIKKPKNLSSPKKLSKKYKGRLFDIPGVIDVEGILSAYYGVHAMTEILNTLPDEHFIICPLYGEKSGDEYITKDFQIGITGGFDYREERWFEATSREMKEEIGLYPKSKSSIGTLLEEEYYGKVWYVSELYIPNTEFVSKEKNNTEVRISGKSPNKIACLVHGTKDHMIKYATKTNIYRYYSTDKIIGVVFIQVKEAKELIENYYS
jgi:hypothetical protein